MSIENELIQLGESKNLIKNAIIEKGGVVNDSTPLKDYAKAIRDIQGGSKPWNISINNNISTSVITGVIGYSGSKAFIIPTIYVNGKSWELFVKIKKSTSLYSYVSLINAPFHWGSIAIYQYSNGNIGCALGDGSSWIFDDAMEISIPDNDDYFFIKYSFDGNNLYELFSYDKDKNLIGHDSVANSYKLSYMSLALLSHWEDANNPTGSFIDLSESYIKVDGEYVQGGI